MNNKQLRRLIGETIIVHTMDKQSIRGVLKEVGRTWVVLGNPEYLNEARSTEMPGEAWIDDRNRSWIHRPGGQAP